MYKLYLITGATGYLGGAVIKELLRRDSEAHVRALVLKGDKLADRLPDKTEIVYGKVDDKSSMADFFQGTGRGTCVIHCAGIISIASKLDERLRRINVGGTRNITDLCREYGVSKLIHVSTVHAIPEKPGRQRMSEVRVFSPDLVDGNYAKTKAEATAYVLKAAKGGLNASVVHPSGIIGPYDTAIGTVTGMIINFCNGKMPIGVIGGYDFVDVRDVASGIVSCCEAGRPGECYILANRHITIREMFDILQKYTKGKKTRIYAPLSLVKLAAPLCEKYCIRKNLPLVFTPYSIYTLGTNSNFSHEKAVRELGYKPRDIEETLKDTVKWLREIGKIKGLKSV